jgi:protein-S-isoprenylcysteine O-methyltransferase Ste14
MSTKSVFTPLVIVRVVFFVVVIPLLALIVSGRWGWWQAWAFALICTGGFIVSRVAIARRNPDLLAERARFTEHKDIKPWDKVLAPVLSLGGNVVPLVAGLEERWSPTNAYGAIGTWAGLILLLAGYALSTWAVYENRFFSGVVRIQKERGHHVVDSGPYRWVRHPGYAGGLAAFLAIPLFLDSRYAWLPMLLFVGATVLRTSLEDRTLQQELPGYKEYAQKVRYRLLPGIW